MKFQVIVLFILLITFETTQQLFFKLGSIKENKRFICYTSGIIMYLLYVAAWFKVIKHVPLGIALPLMGINYVIVTISGMYFFKEKANTLSWIGISLILAGFVMVWLGGGAVYE